VTQPNILAADLATGNIATCLLRADGERFLADLPGDKPHSQTLLPLLRQLLDDAGLQWNDLGLFALGAGPGSFTGIRIAAATLAGLNAPLGLRFLHLSSLAITARQVKDSDPLWIIEDARAGDAYVGHYRDGAAVEPDSCHRWEDVAAMTPASFACHNNPAIDMAQWQRLQLTTPRSQALAAAVEAALATTADIDSLPTYPEPAYLQVSQAERNAHA